MTGKSVSKIVRINGGDQEFRGTGETEEEAHLDLAGSLLSLIQRLQAHRHEALVSARSAKRDLSEPGK